MNENTLGLILEIAKIGSGLATQIIPIFIHHDANGVPIAVSIAVLMSATDARNAETLLAIAKANAQPMKG